MGGAGSSAGSGAGSAVQLRPAGYREVRAGRVDFEQPRCTADEGCYQLQLKPGHVLFMQHERSSQAAPSPALGYGPGSSVRLKASFRQMAEVISLKQFSTANIHKVD